MIPEQIDIKRHLFLTGEKQVGKSTLLRKLIETKELDCAGFETLPWFWDGKRRGFLLHGRITLPPYENDCIISVRTAERKSVPVLPVFNENGVVILKKSVESSSPFLLMDELGKLEKDADDFCNEVLRTLDSPKRVIGVLQQCQTPLIEAIRNREDVTVLTVTEENRIRLTETVIREFR